MQYGKMGRATVSRGGKLLLAATIGSAIVAAMLTSAVAQTAPNPPPAPAASTTSETQTASAQAPKPKVDPEDKVICKYQEEIGSRLGSTKVCRTKRQWEQMSRDAGDAVSAASKR